MVNGVYKPTYNWGAHPVGKWWFSQEKWGFHVIYRVISRDKHKDIYHSEIMVDLPSVGHRMT